MVFMEVSFMNTALQLQLKILKLSNLKPNFSELARQYGVDRRTVKKYYDGYEGKPAHRQKSSKLDKHYDLIKNKLSIRGTNIKSVYEFILSEVDPDLGTYSNFNKYVKAKGLKPKKTPKGHPRYETDKAVQAQVDWKENISLVNKYGEIFTFQVFAYKLGYSRYTHFIYKLLKTRQDVFDCLIESFQATGGVPKEILFDNMASIVDRDGNRIQISNQVRAFAKDFNFKIKLCKPRHPFTKGKVESVNKFLIWLQPYEGEFETEEELISILEKINKKVNMYSCQETRVPPILLFQKEKEYLQPLPRKDVLESYLSHNRQTIVRPDSLVTYMNNKYSVPPEYIGKPVRLFITDNTLQIYYSTNLVASHALSQKNLNYKKEHYQKLLGFCLKDESSVEELAEKNLHQMDQLL